jgi:hypothetical protein
MVSRVNYSSRWLCHGDEDAHQHRTAATGIRRLHEVQITSGPSCWVPVNGVCKRGGAPAVRAGAWIAPSDLGRVRGNLAGRLCRLGRPGRDADETAGSPPRPCAAPVPCLPMRRPGRDGDLAGAARACRSLGALTAPAQRPAPESPGSGLHADRGTFRAGPAALHQDGSAHCDSSTANAVPASAGLPTPHTLT